MILNKDATRKYILDQWKLMRPGHEMTQVSATTLAYFERRLHEIIDANIHSHPSMGKTIKIG